MPEKVDKRELIRLVARRTGRDPVVVAEVIEGTLAEIVEALEIGKSVSLRDFGTFYVRPERAQWVFKFNPSQRLRKVLGWSSTYRGDG